MAVGPSRWVTVDMPHCRYTKWPLYAHCTSSWEQLDTNLFQTPDSIPSKTHKRKKHFEKITLPCNAQETLFKAFTERAIMDFNGNLLTCCGKTYLRAFLSWIAGMALILHHWCSKRCLLNNQGLQYLRRGDEQIVIANPVFMYSP